MLDLQERRARQTPLDVALLPPRAALAAIMLYHGRDKLAPHRRPAAASAFEALGLHPGRFWSAAAGAAEAAAGAAALAGILTRPAALAVLVTQAAAVAKVHARRGFAATEGGYEYNLALMAIAAALLLSGPGRYSLHGLLARRLGGWLRPRRWLRWPARRHAARRWLALLR